MRGIVWFAALTAILIMVLPPAAYGSEKTEQLLSEIDPWVTTDTAKIKAYIDSAGAVTEKMLESSPFWEQTNRDLSFLLGIDLMSTPRIDNTGRIYFNMRITGETEALFYMDRSMSWPQQLTPNNWPKEGIGITGVKPHPSGAFVLVSVDKFGDEMHDIWYFGRDGRFRPLLENRTVRYSGIIFDEDNPDQFYLFIDDRSQIHFGRYTISTGKLDTLYTEPGAIYPTDYRKGKILFVRWFSFSSGQVAMFDVNTKSVTDLSDTSLFWGADLTADGRALVLTSRESREDEFMKFCLIDPAKPKEFNVIFDPKKETDSYMFVRKLGLVMAAVNTDGYSEFTGFDLDGNPVPMPKLDIGVIGGRSADDISANELGDFTLSFSSPTIPPTCYTFKLGDKTVSPIGVISTFGFDFSDVKVEVIHYKSDDGVMIPALLYRPADARQDGSNPAIIDYHGGPPGQSRPYFQRNLAFALSKGFVFMLPNVRGSTGYGPAYERADNLDGRFASLVDCERAIDYLINEGWSRPDKIAVWGASYGGYVVNWLMTHAPEKIACGVSLVGVSDVDHTNRNTSQVFAKGWEQEFGPVGSDLTRRLSPIFLAENLTKPIMITAGYNDPRVPPSDPRRFAYVLSRLGKPVWYYEETEAGHGGSTKSQVIFDFASRYTFTMMHVMK